MVYREQQRSLTCVGLGCGTWHSSYGSYRRGHSGSASLRRHDGLVRVYRARHNESSWYGVGDMSCHDDSGRDWRDREFGRTECLRRSIGRERLEEHEGHL